jgi:hypothetical protein
MIRIELVERSAVRLLRWALFSVVLSLTAIWLATGFLPAGSTISDGLRHGELAIVAAGTSGATIDVAISERCFAWWRALAIAFSAILLFISAGLISAATLLSHVNPTTHGLNIISFTQPQIIATSIVVLIIAAAIGLVTIGIVDRGQW